MSFITSKVPTVFLTKEKTCFFLAVDLKYEETEEEKNV